MDRKGRMLIVDDEPDVLDFIERTFRREYRVERAVTVEEAVRAIESATFDVVLTDQRMPRGSGFGILERAKALQPRAVRVLLSGYSDERQCPTCAHVRLVKPIDAEGLRGAVADALARFGVPPA